MNAADRMRRNAAGEGLRQIVIDARIIDTTALHAAELLATIYDGGVDDDTYSHLLDRLAQIRGFSDSIRKHAGKTRTELLEAAQKTGDNSQHRKTCAAACSAEAVTESETRATRAGDSSLPETGATA